MNLLYGLLVANALLLVFQACGIVYLVWLARKKRAENDNEYFPPGTTPGEDE